MGGCRGCKCGGGLCCDFNGFVDSRCPIPIQRLYHWYRHNRLLFLTFFGVVLGIIIGLALSRASVDEAWARFLGFPGSIFLRCLRLMILPIIIASIINGAATLHARATGLMAAKALAYFFLSTLACATMAFFMAVIIHPGDPGIRNQLRGTTPSDPELDEQGCQDLTPLDAVLDLFRNAFPENIVLATMKQVQTVYRPMKPKYISNSSDWTNATRCVRTVRTNGHINALGLIVFCMAFGTALGSLAERGQTMVKFFSLLDIVVTRLVRLFMWFTPVGVASLICERLMLTEDLGLLFSNLGWLMLTLVVCLTIHQLLLLPIFYFIVVRRNPFRFTWNVAQALLTSFALASSVATLPVTMRCMEEKNKVNLQVLRFVLPVGATINMDGTAMFSVIAPMFLAQIHEISITVAKGITLIFLASAVSVAAAAIPSAALFLMLLLTNVLGVPSADVSILFTIDWLLDRLRTTSNVLSDCYGAALVEKWSGMTNNKMETQKDDDPELTSFQQRAETYAAVTGDQPCPAAAQIESRL